MLISLSGTYYAYCSIPESAVSALIAAGSMGQFYNSQIKGRYACR
jgi:KTSC domain